jgi:hypothetical protein
MLDGWMVEIHVCQISTPGHAVETGFTPTKKSLSQPCGQKPLAPQITPYTPHPHVHGRGLVA